GGLALVVGGDQLADIDQVGRLGQPARLLVDRHRVTMWPIVAHVACPTVAGVILVAGEALIDLVPSSETAEVLAAHPGGGPFNAARTIGRLEQPVAYLRRLSRDPLRHASETPLADG